MYFNFGSKFNVNGVSVFSSCTIYVEQIHPNHYNNRLYPLDILLYDLDMGMSQNLSPRSPRRDKTDSIADLSKPSNSSNDCGILEIRRTSWGYMAFTMACPMKKYHVPFWPPEKCWNFSWCQWMLHPRKGWEEMKSPFVLHGMVRLSRDMIVHIYICIYRYTYMYMYIYMYIYV